MGKKRKHRRKNQKGRGSYFRGRNEQRGKGSYFRGRNEQRGKGFLKIFLPQYEKQIRNYYKQRGGNFIFPYRRNTGIIPNYNQWSGSAYTPSLTKERQLRSRFGQKPSGFSNRFRTDVFHV